MPGQADRPVRDSTCPHFLSWVILGGIFLVILSPTGGMVNGVLEWLGFESIFFLGSNRWFRFTVITTHLWEGGRLGHDHPIWRRSPGHRREPVRGSPPSTAPAACSRPAT